MSHLFSALLLSSICFSNRHNFLSRLINKQVVSATDAAVANFFCTDQDPRTPNSRMTRNPNKYRPMPRRTNKSTVIRTDFFDCLCLNPVTNRQQKKGQIGLIHKKLNVVFYLIGFLPPLRIFCFGSVELYRHVAHIDSKIISNSHKLFCF